MPSTKVFALKASSETNLGRNRFAKPNLNRFGIFQFRAWPTVVPNVSVMVVPRPKFANIWGKHLDTNVNESNARALFNRTMHSIDLLSPTKEEVHVFAPVCLSVCLLARLLQNAPMDLDEMLRVDRCWDVDELINF